MRILVEHGSHSLTNLGDLAMLEVCVERVREQWPEAEVLIPTRIPARLAEHLPGATPVDLENEFGHPEMAAAFSRLQSRPVLGFILSIMTLLRTGLGISPPTSIDRLPQAPDLVLQAGSGIFADPFAISALRRVAVLKAAQRKGIPTAMLSQGIGPLRNPLLRRALAGTTAEMKLIACREQLFSPSLLYRLGAAPDRVRTTGDDSLELAARMRPDVAGTAVGMNLRWSRYSGWDPADPAQRYFLASLVEAVARAAGAPIVPVTIHRSDGPAVRDLAPAGLRFRSGPEPPFSTERALAAIGSCRMVVTTSYHGAVLALGQGIPAACLYRSEYYRRKFQGLAHWYPRGCVLVEHEALQPQQLVIDQLSEIAASSESVRTALLTTTGDLILKSRKAYKDLFRIVACEL